MREIILKDLKEGDIFKLGKQSWNSFRRFIKVSYFDDKENIWIEKPNENTRSCVFLSDPFYGNNEGGFTWWDAEQIVYIPEFPVSRFKKSKGKPCVLHSNGELWHVFPYELNKINIETHSLLKL